MGYLKKILIIITSLLNHPLTVKELQKIIIERTENEGKTSVDSLYDDLEKLKEIGFIFQESKRSKSGVKYSLKKLPFAFDLDNYEKELLSEILSFNSSDKEALLAFFAKISPILNFDQEEIEAEKNYVIQGKKNYREIKKKFQQAITNNRRISFCYQPIAKEEKIYEGYPYRIEKDEKNTERVILYVQETGAYLTFNLERMISVTKIFNSEVYPPEFPPFFAEFRLYHPASRAYHLLPGEKVVEETDDYKTIRCRYYTSFQLIQKVFKYGDKVEILSPPEARLEIKNKITKMKELYE